MKLIIKTLFVLIVITFCFPVQAFASDYYYKEVETETVVYNVVVDNKTIYINSNLDKVNDYIATNSISDYIITNSVITETEYEIYDGNEVIDKTDDENEAKEIIQNYEEEFSISDIFAIIFLCFVISVFVVIFVMLIYMVLN